MSYRVTEDSNRRVTEDGSPRITETHVADLVAEVGSYSLTGVDASLLLSRALNAAVGDLVLTGEDATLTLTSVPVEEEPVRRGGGTSKRKGKRPRYWWEEENIPRQPEKVVVETPTPPQPRVEFEIRIPESWTEPAREIPRAPEVHVAPEIPREPDPAPRALVCVAEPAKFAVRLNEPGVAYARVFGSVEHLYESISAERVLSAIAAAQERRLRVGRRRKKKVKSVAIVRRPEVISARPVFLAMRKLRRLKQAIRFHQPPTS